MMRSLITVELGNIQINPSEEQLSKLEHYAALLVEWNEKINLTALLSEADIARKHFADSLSVMNMGLIKEDARMIDVGTGAGFPGIPLAIMYPLSKVILLDSTQKRVSFLQHVIEELGLSNTQAICARAEIAAREKIHREKYDVALSRAVAPLQILAEISLGFVKKKGIMLAFKGTSAEEEVSKAKNCIRIMGGSARACIPAGLEGYDHKLVVIDKIEKTPLQCPRSYANIQKKPII